MTCDDKRTLKNLVDFCGGLTKNVFTVSIQIRKTNRGTKNTKAYAMRVATQ